MPTNRFLVDTSAWIFALKSEGIPEIRDRIDQIISDEEILTTGIIKLELLSGAKTEKEFDRLKKNLDALDMVETDDRLWESAYKLVFKLRRQGITVPHTDILIAACGFAAKATIVHADAHFDMIGSKSNLKTENLLHFVT